MYERVIVRLPNWLGDTVMAVPALRALRQGSPRARLLLAGPWSTLLAEQGLADVLVPYPRAWRGRLRTADVMRDFRADLVVLLPNSFEAALAALYWRGRRRVGFATAGRGPLLTDRLPLPEPRRHQIDEYLMLAERVGVTPCEKVPQLEPPEPSSPNRRRASALLQELGGARRGGRWVGVHLGAAYGPAKTWTLPRITEFCRLALDAGDVPILLGEPREHVAAETIQRSVPVPSLVGRDAPELLPALLSELQLLVSGDTGVAHLAAALGTPVVTLFGPTDPALSAPRGPATIVRHPVPCAPCFYRVCPIDHPCMHAIGADRVAAAARKIDTVGPR